MLFAFSTAIHEYCLTLWKGMRVLATYRFALPIDAWHAFPCGYIAWFYNHYIGLLSHT